MSTRKLTIEVEDSVYHKAELLRRQLGINSLDQLFDQMVEELDWSLNYSSLVKAALLADRATARQRHGEVNGQGDSPRTGEQPD